MTNEQTTNTCEHHSITTNGVCRQCRALLPNISAQMASEQTTKQTNEITLYVQSWNGVHYDGKVIVQNPSPETISKALDVPVICLTFNEIENDSVLIDWSKGN